MFYTIYKVTNNLNGKIYIGAHKTNQLDDGYMGSGKIIKKAIKKYGEENFEKEILEVFENSETMYDMESKLITKDFVKESTNYNLKEGGEGGFDHINLNGLNKQGGSDGTSFNKQFDTDIEFREKFSKLQSEKMKQKHKDGLIKYDNFTNKNHSEEAKKKIGEANSKHQKGEGNSQYGKIWIHSLELKLSKKIKKEELPTWEQDGWLKGRKMKF